MLNKNTGSGKIQDLWYRCQWYMVTQKGIQGITPYEKITYSHKNNWADVLDEKLCVPFQSELRILSIIESTADYIAIFSFDLQ